MNTNGTANLSTSGTPFTAQMPLQWNTFAIIMLITAATTAILNMLVLVTFFRGTAFHTPFNIYLVNLMAANLLHILLVKPFDLISTVARGWNLSFSTCTYYLWASYIVDSGMYHATALIAINRIWAVTFPVSYKYRHTRVAAGCICLGSWVYVHTLQLPEIIRDALCDETSGKNITVISGIRSKNPARPDNALGSKVLAPHKKRSSGYIIYTALTITAFVCWTPNLVFFKMNLLSGHYDETVYEITAIMFMLQAALDPLFFVFSLKDIRFYLKAALCCTCL
ncbi:5-hydroxytryptamine receptor 1D-like [Paramacrobiotus metropolitanus]|uniref:5-hydroxytryptamine receptor 1D-like n=1 Tax=Paramacrobiotus metropolitanus TaxID=2943436 RepID=UPI002445D996|nr:5-hydroxytryptamine receptor 1D-like [Paramacrobiotus metropolitanus]